MGHLTNDFPPDAADLRKARRVTVYPHANPSSRLTTFRVEEFARRAVAFGKGQADGFLCALWNCLVSPMAIEVRAGEAGIGRVDLDTGLPKFRGKLHRQHVQGGFRGTVTNQLTGCVS